MIRRDQRGQLISEVVHPIVPEWKCRQAPDDAAIAQNAQIGPQRYAAQSHDHPHFFQQIQFALEIGTATGQFLRQRFVVRRRAAPGGRDVGSAQLQPVLARAALGLRRESGLIQRTIQKIARTITGKHPSSTI